DPLLRLPALDLAAREARGLVAAADRIAHRDADAPGRIVAREYLADRIAETAAAAARNNPGKGAGAQELGSTQPAAAIRGLEPHVGESLVRQKHHGGARILEIMPRARQVVALVERLRDGRIHVGNSRGRRSLID